MNPSGPSNITPPKWPLQFLRFFLKEAYLEEIEGDLEELFLDNAAQMPLRQAQRLYTWEVFKLLRPILLKNLAAVRPLPPLAMYRNYFKISTRGLLKHPLHAFINVFGLAVAIGVCIFLYAFARWTFSTDQFHVHKNSVYLVTFFADRDGSVQQFGRTPRPLGEGLREDFTHVRKVCRVEDRPVVVKYGDNVFHERIRCTDPEFLEMFTFPLKWGNAGSLSDANSIILSEPTAIKYFGETNPVGKSLLVKFGPDQGKAFKVSGVARAFPKARTIDFDFLVNFRNLSAAEPGYDFRDWSAFVNATLIQVDQPADIKYIQRGMARYKELQNQAVPEDWAISSFALEPLATLHERSGEIRDDISRSSGDNYKSVTYLSIVGAVLLALACFNYINIAIVSAAKRLKEIGVRKTMGAGRHTIIVQFLAENVVLTSLALVLGLLIGMTVFIPGFERLWGSLDLDFRLTDPVLWLYLPAVLGVTSLASGLYPSLYISRFQVVGILKGSVRFGRNNPLTKVFLGLQLLLACVFITGAVMFTQNSLYLDDRSWGYNPSQTLYATVPDGAAYEKLSARLAQHPNVLSVAGSSHHLGKSNATAVLHFPGRPYEVEQLSVGASYFQTLGLQLTIGRVFREHSESDRRAVVVNELLVKQMGWRNPVGQRFRIEGVPHQVIGVVKDFHTYSFAKPVQPTIFRVAPKAEYRYLSLRVKPGTEVKTYQVLQAQWAALFPETPFAGGHQEDVWGNYFEAISIHGIVWRVFAFIAVSLAGLGLYGLVTLNVAGRIREFSIRKVLGAGARNLAVNITHPYVVLFAVALVLGAPVSHGLMKLLIESAYTYHMPVDYTGVVTAVLVLVLVLLLTVLTQVGKVVKSNPVNGLKAE